ncbi:hypothetical protein, partial [Pseudomonas jessenii]|uniref:hypothetical protein n=1 Tax=Pseudomonas jessenii TaxID=77298 RepID=UPI0019D41F54
MTLAAWCRAVSWRFSRAGSLLQDCGEPGCYAAQKQNPYLHTQIGVSEFNLDDDLLSHGETPHY